MYFDGAAILRGYGAGIVLITPEEAHTPLAIKLKYNSSNNTTEYEACIIGLETALSLGVEKIDFFGDSNLIISQIRGDWKVKHEKLVPFHEYLESLRSRFKEITFYHLPREENQLADSLATLASMIEIPTGVKLTPLVIEQREKPSYELVVVVEEIEDGIPWYFDVRNYIENEEYPKESSSKDKRAIRRFAAQFVVYANKLWKKSYTGYNLECLYGREARRMMEEVYVGVCGPRSYKRAYASEKDNPARILLDDLGKGLL